MVYKKIRWLFQQEVYGSDSPADGTLSVQTSRQNLKFFPAWIVSFRQFGCFVSESWSTHQHSRGLSECRMTTGTCNIKYHRLPIHTHFRKNATTLTANPVTERNLSRSPSPQLYIHLDSVSDFKTRRQRQLWKAYEGLTSFTRSPAPSATTHRSIQWPQTWTAWMSPVVSCSFKPPRSSETLVRRLKYTGTLSVKENRETNKINSHLDFVRIFNTF